VADARCRLDRARGPHLETGAGRLSRPSRRPLPTTGHVRGLISFQGSRRQSPWKAFFLTGRALRSMTTPFRPRPLDLRFPHRTASALGHAVLTVEGHQCGDDAFYVDVARPSHSPTTFKKAVFAPTSFHIKTRGHQLACPDRDRQEKRTAWHASFDGRNCFSRLTMFGQSYDVAFARARQRQRLARAVPYQRSHGRRSTPDRLPRSWWNAAGAGPRDRSNRRGGAFTKCIDGRAVLGAMSGISGCHPTGARSGARKMRIGARRAGGRPARGPGSRSWTATTKLMSGKPARGGDGGEGKG